MNIKLFYMIKNISGRLREIVHEYFSEINVKSILFQMKNYSASPFVTPKFSYLNFFEK